jgi:hypothetical protein
VSRDKSSGLASDLTRLLRRSEQGDRSVLPALRREFDQQPDLWEQVGNLSLQAQRSMVAMAAGKNEMVREALERKIGELRIELAGPAATPLERLLADRIVTCWLDVHAADRMCTAHHQDGGVLAVGDYYQRRQDRAHRRYLQAIKALVQVRRLLTPVVQVNIAEQQVNVAR